MPVGHSKDGVKYLVNSVPKEFKDLVFGFVDCDFDDHNETLWADPSTKIFRPACHELENFLLDFEVLSELSRVVDAATIQQRAEKIARDLQWWMAGKKALRQIRQTVNVNFPEDPKPNTPAANNLASIVAHIVQSGFPGPQVTAYSQWDQARISALVQQNYDDFSNDLASGQWKNTYSGKEIFRLLKSQVQGLPKLDVDGYPPSRMHKAAGALGAAGMTDANDTPRKWQRSRHRAPRAEKERPLLYKTPP
jgi:hypothetical protein